MGKILGRGIRALIRSSDEDRDTSNPDEVRYDQMRKDYEEKRQQYSDLLIQINAFREQLSLQEMVPGSKGEKNEDTLRLLEEELGDIKKDLDHMKVELKSAEKRLKTDDGLDLVAVSPDFIRQKEEREKNNNITFDSIAKMSIPEITRSTAIRKDEKMAVVSKLKSDKEDEMKDEVLSMLKASVTPTITGNDPVEIVGEVKISQMYEGETVPEDGSPAYSLSDEERSELSGLGLITPVTEDPVDVQATEDASNVSDERMLERSIHNPADKIDEATPAVEDTGDNATLSGEWIDPRKLRENVYEQNDVTAGEDIYSAPGDEPEAADEAIREHGTNLQKVREEIKALSDEERMIREEVDPSTTWEELHDRGFAMARIGEFEKAIIYYDMALGICDTSEELYSNKGVAQYSLGNFEEAKGCFGNAIKINSKYEQAWNNLGVVMRTENKPKEAIRCYTSAIKANPRYKNAWYNLGFIMEDQGLLEKALWYYNKALDINPKYDEALYSKKALLVKLREKQKSRKSRKVKKVQKKIRATFDRDADTLVEDADVDLYDEEILFSGDDEIDGLFSGDDGIDGLFSDDGAVGSSGDEKRLSPQPLNDLKRRKKKVKKIKHLAM